MNETQHKTCLNEGLETLALPYFAIDLAGKIQYANLAGQDFFHSSAKKLETNNIFELLKPSEELRALCKVAHEQNYQSTALEIHFMLGNLTEVLCDIVVSPNSEGEFLNIIFWPKTESVGLHNRKSNLQKDKSFGQIGRALAHEVKNPLAGIRGAAQLLMLDAEPEQKPMARLIIDETDRIHRLIDRVESLGFEDIIKTEPVNIHEILERVVKLAQTGFASELKLVRNFDVSLPMVLGEADSLTQIFINLAKNAAEAAREKGDVGQIIFATSYRHGLKLRDGGGQHAHLPIEISITDNGFGIEEELRDFIFDPFVTTKSSGSGLGLALVRKLVRSNNGTIEFESHSGRTTFKVRLPMAAQINQNLAFAEEKSE